MASYDVASNIHQSLAEGDGASHGVPGGASHRQGGAG